MKAIIKEEKMLAALLNTTTPETKAEEALGRISDVFDYMTFVATLICLMFFLTRTLVSFPYNGLWKRPFSLSDFVSRIHSECYLFARPVARYVPFSSFSHNRPHTCGPQHHLLNQVVMCSGVHRVHEYLP